MRLYLDPGHGGNDPGAVGNGLVEKDITLKISLKIREKLKAYEGVEVRMSRTTDKTVSLQQRTDDANRWKADYYLSIHINAFNGKAHGYEDYIHTPLSDSSETALIRNIMHAEITKKVDFYNRGKKKANFHVIRESHMPALLTECGFIDNPNDAKKLKSDAYLDKIAQGHVNGVVKAFKLKKKPKEVEAVTGVFYRVVTGSFKEKKNANDRVAALSKKGFKSFLDYHNGFYRVVTGSFSEKANADKRVKALNAAGFKSFIDVYKK